MRVARTGAAAPKKTSLTVEIIVVVVLVIMFDVFSTNTAAIAAAVCLILSPRRFFALRSALCVACIPETEPCPVVWVTPNLHEGFGGRARTLRRLRSGPTQAEYIFAISVA